MSTPPYLLRHWLSVLAVIIFAFSIASCAATPPPDNLDANAQQAYTDENWPVAETLYRQLTAQQPNNGRYWYRQGVALRHLEKLAEAGNALDKASENQVPALYVDFERAIIAAAQNNNKAAIGLLQTAAAAGLSGKTTVLDNDYLAALKNEPGFNELLKHLDSNQFPCGAEQFHRFDFWIGEWDVTTANGQVAGKNKITSRENDCVLFEQWNGTGGSTGISMNYYDVNKKKWVQHWISSGTQINIEGDLRDGSMVLEGHIYYIRQDNKADFRGTWTLLDDGRVRQFFEQANADGQWSAWFEGFYTRAEGS